MSGKATSSSSNASSPAKLPAPPAKNYEAAFGTLSSQYGYSQYGYGADQTTKATKPSAAKTFNISLLSDQTHAPAPGSQPTKNPWKK